MLSGRTSSLFDLQERWVDLITGRRHVDMGDPVFATAVARQDREVERLISLLAIRPAPQGIFTDAPFIEEANVVATYQRLAQMASSWATPGSRYAGDTALLNHLIKALADGNTFIYNNTQAEYGNWWSWEIGTPKAVTDTLAILGSEVDAELCAKYFSAIDHFIPDPTLQYPDSRGKILSEGANRVDICQGIIIRSILAGDTARLADAVNALSPAWQTVTSGDGFYPDGSFIQHDTIAYTGTYGVTLLSGLAKIFALLEGSEWAPEQHGRAALFKRVENSYLPFLHNGLMMDTVRGRSISRNYLRGFDDGANTIEAILWLAQAADPATASRWRALCKGQVERNSCSDPLAGASIPRTALFNDLFSGAESAALEAPGHHYFPSMDRSVYRGNGWAMALSLCSARSAWYECGNGENNLGAHTGSGMSYLYTGTQGHFDDDFWPTANLSRLPGITADTTALPPLVEGEWGGVTPQNEWTGGLTLGNTGAVGMHLLGPGGTGLAARKAWFYSADMVVALGSDIQTKSAGCTETVMEHRNLGAAGGLAITVDGAVHDGVHGVPTVHKSPLWAHLEGTGGYLVLGDDELTVLRERRTGAWSNINTGGTPETVTREYATMFFTHGQRPSANSYAYALLPGASLQETETAASRQPVKVLRNDATAQGVKLGKHTLAAVFWVAGTVGKISVDKAACLVWDDSAGHAQLAVSDPTQGAASITVTLAGSLYTLISSDTDAVLDQDVQGNTRISIPTQGLRGSTATVTLHRSASGRLPTEHALVDPLGRP